MINSDGELVLVIGGTRGTGLLITQLLLEQGYSVRVLARNPGRAVSRLPAAAELMAGDITLPESLPPAVSGVNHIVFTAGVPSGRVARESLVRMTDYQGVLNTITAAMAAGFSGRFVYLNSLGVTVPSWSARLLNCMKRNTLVWRRRVETDIRASGIDYTIIRVGFLLNRPSGRRALKVTQEALPLTPGNRIPRSDVAEAFVAAMRHPRASRTTFDIVSEEGPARVPAYVLMAGLTPDSALL
jgi:uncharacterized protein YbjT (DUF2867 family)